MTAEEFIKAGEGLFGRRWKAPLARALQIDPVTIWRYATGQSEVPIMVELALLGLRHRKEPPVRSRRRASGPVA